MFAASQHEANLEPSFSEVLTQAGISMKVTGSN